MAPSSSQKTPEVKRTGPKHHFLDRTAVLMSSGNCDDLHKTNRRTSQSVLSMDWGGAGESLP